MEPHAGIFGHRIKSDHPIIRRRGHPKNHRIRRIPDKSDNDAAFRTEHQLSPAVPVFLVDNGDHRPDNG
jgi:hypothetical protein